MTARPQIVLEQVSKTFDGADAPAVEGLSLEVHSGEILALLGPSGCGKTTTLRLIAGFEVPDRGRIVIGGRVVEDGRVRVPPERRGIGFVFQDYALFPHLTVRDNIAFGLRDLPAAARAERLALMLRVCELEGLEERFPHELSGGQQQRTALGRAMAPGYEVVLLDEPLSNLDADLRSALRSHVRRTLKSTGRTAVLVTHDQEEAFEIADRVGILNRGRLEQVGTPEEVYYAPATRFVALFVGAANFVPGLVEGGEIRTELGCYPNEPGLPPGARVELMIRPASVALAPDPGGAGVITSEVFRGPERLYTVRLASGLELRCSGPSWSDLGRGTRVAVRASPTHIVAFPLAGT